MRREERFPYQGKVRLVWHDERGDPTCVMAKCYEVSPSGLRVITQDRVPLRAYVSFQVMGTDLNGTGSVRHCTRTGIRYMVGLEFTGGLRWKGAAEPVKTASPSP